jgi:HK97 family phage portal protein
MSWWEDKITMFRKGLGLPVVVGIYHGRLSASGHATGLSFQEAVTRGYKNLVWVHRCVNAIGSAVGSVPWKAFRVQSDGKQTWLPGHQLERLLERPNKHYTRKEMMEAWAVYLSLSVNSYQEVVFVQGKPYELYVLRPDWMLPVPDAMLYVSGYKMDAGQGGKAEFKPEEILHFKYLDPMNEFIGMSPLAAAARTIATEDAASKWNKSIFDNSAVPSGILKIPATSVQKKERDAIRDELNIEFTQENLHRPMVLWGGMEWQKMSMDAKDLDFLKQRELNKFEICAVLECPPQVVGATVDPTYANYEVARTAFWEDCIIPKLEWFKSVINARIAPYFGTDIIADFDISDIPALRSSFKEKVETSHRLWLMGYPINQINRRVGLGFDDVLWGDAWWAQMNMMPIINAPTPEQPSVGTDAVEPSPDEL